MPPATLVVDAEAWPRALQAARAIRGESGPIADFTIELLDDGCRAIEPHGLVTYRVKTAPDDTPLGEVRAASRVPPRPEPSGPRLSSGLTRGGVAQAVPAAQAPPSSRPAIVAEAATSVPPASPAAADAPDATDAPAAVASAPDAPPAKAAPAAPAEPPELVTTASPAARQDASQQARQDELQDEPRDGPRGASEHARAPGKADELPTAIVVFQRIQAPTAASPLHYREYAFALPPGTNEELAEHVLFVELSRLQQEMATLPPGKLVNLAAFDRIFTGRPTALPIATLTWKDWRGEPVLDHPLRRGTPAAPMPLSFPPPSGAAPPGDMARISSLPSATIPSGPPSSPPSSPPSAPTVSHRAPGSASLHADMTIRIPPHDPPMLGDGVPPAEDRHLDSLDGPSLPASAAAALVHDTLPPDALPGSGSDPFPRVAGPPSSSAPHSSPSPLSSPSRDRDGDSQREPRSFGSIASTRSSIPRVAFPRKRGDELLTVLFEAMYDLAFLRDAVEGADFCVGLALEQIPATRGFIHLYDMDRREFVVVAGRGVAAGNRLLARTADQDERFRAVIRQAGATIDGEAVYAPIVQAGRHIGILEIEGALDQLPFGEAEGHALVYIARQYAEFVSQRGVVIDAARVSEMPRSR